MKHLKKLVLIIYLVGIHFVMHAQTVSNKGTYVLVHGAWHGGWCWKDVKHTLNQKGYEVFTPTLSGLGERKHLNDPSVNLNTHINDIVHMIEMEDLHNVYLVGHSYAGAVIAGVADRIPERLAKLIFLDAMIIEDGQSAISLQPEQVRKIQMKNIKRKENFEPFDVALFGITDPIIAADMTKKLTPQPFNTFAQILKLKHPYGNGLPLTYIACTDPQLPIMKEMTDKIKANKNLNWQYLEIATGHDAMVTRPSELADIFVKLVE